MEKSLLERFENFEIAASDFDHAYHIQVAYEMLSEYEFMDACSRYAKTIRTMASNAGTPKKYNATITMTFMGVVAERMANTDADNFTSFLESNQDLHDKSLLHKWYSEERLQSDLARQQFLLPDR